MKQFSLIFALCAFLAAGPLHAAGTSASENDSQWLLSKASAEEQTYNSSGRILADPDLESYLNLIVKSLQTAAPQNNLSFRVRVIKDPCLNGFFLPNGAIYVTTGILARLENEAQLAMILAHEMAHGLRKHALTVLRAQEKEQRAAPVALRETFTHDAKGAEGAISPLEYEADRVGFGLVIKAGYDPHEGIDLFRHLEKVSADEDIHEPFMDQADSGLRLRMRHLEKVLRSQGVPSEPGMIKGRPFLEKTKGALLENVRLELQLGRIAAARQEIMKYLRIVPRDAEAFYLLGEVSRLKGDDGSIRLARALYEKAISLDPSYAEPYRALGFIQYKAGELTLAGKSFRWCLLLSPRRKDRAYIHAYLKKCGETDAGGKKGS